VKKLSPIAILNKSDFFNQIIENTKYFTQFVIFALNHHDIILYADNTQTPTVMMIYDNPACILYGDITDADVSEFIAKIPEHTYIVGQHPSWNPILKSHLPNINIYPRNLFDASTLSKDHLVQMMTKLPEGYEIRQINTVTIPNDQMIQEDLLNRFFDKSDFAHSGFGFGLYYNNDMIGFIATNYPVVSDEAEVYVRVDYNSQPIHRHKGFGLQLSIYFLLECFKRGYVPIWDSANDISAQLALKLGFVLKEAWEMFYFE